MSAKGPRRRDVLKAGAAASVVGGVASSLTGCVEREERFFEQVTGRDNERSGISRWRLAVCGQCAAGCTTTVRVVDGDAKKIEGSPDDPSSRGGVCALGHSALQEVYDPDRLLEPLARSAGRTESALEAVTWEQAIQRTVEALHAAEQADRGVAILGSVQDSVQSRLCGALARGLRGEHYFWEPVWRSAERRASKEVLGWDDVPSYDLARADLVLSFGAPLLDRWRNPVWAAAVLRGERPRSQRRPTLIQVSPRFGLTEAAADLWLAPRCGTEGVLAEALANSLRARSAESSSVDAAEGEGDADADRALEGDEGLRTACATCDVPYEKVERLFELLSRAERPVAVAGGAWVSREAPAESVHAALRLNQVLGRIAEPGGLFAPTPSPLQVPFDPPGPDALRKPLPFDALLGKLRSREVGAVLLVEVDEALLGDEGPLLRELLAEVDTVCSLTALPGASSAVSDIVLPVHSALERWHLAVADSPGPGALVVASNPVVQPLGNTLHPADVLLNLGKAALPDTETENSPWSVDGAATLFDDALAATAEAGDRRAAEVLEAAYLAFSVPTESSSGSRSTPTSRRFADRGGLESEDLGGASPQTPLPGSEQRQVSEGPTAGASGSDSGPLMSNAQHDEFVLLPFETPHLASGRGANRAWLQQLPDPLSTVMWSAWAELSPADLHRLGLRTGDWIEVAETAGGGRALEVPVVENPAARPGTVAIPRGYAHVEGRYAPTAARAADLSQLGAGAVPGLGRYTVTGSSVSVRRVATAGADEERHPRLALFGAGLRHHEHVSTRRGRPVPETVVLEKPSRRRVEPQSDAASSDDQQRSEEGIDP